MTTPKQAGFYMPPEWYPHTGCWMAWPCHLESWATIGLERAGIAYARVAKAIAQYEPVTMLVNPADMEQAKNYVVRKSTCFLWLSMTPGLVIQALLFTQCTKRVSRC